MEPVLLLTKSDFTPYIDLSQNLEAVKKLNMHIEHAQTFDIKPLLGDLLYYDLLASFKTYQAGIDAQTEEAPYVPTAKELSYQELLNGKTYQVSGIDIPFKGIKVALVHYTAARLVPNISIQVTPNGMFQKRNEFSDPVESREISRQVQNYQSLANGYWQEVRTFLNLYPETFPLWRNDSCGTSTGKKSGARIYGINSYGRR